VREDDTSTAYNEASVNPGAEDGKSAENLEANNNDNVENEKTSGLEES
jgi:hypothetical protein